VIDYVIKFLILFTYKENNFLRLEALHRFVTQGIPDHTGVLCRSDGGGAEDVEMGKCMENLGVKAGDSRFVFKKTQKPQF